MCMCETNFDACRPSCFSDFKETDRPRDVRELSRVLEMLAVVSVVEHSRKSAVGKPTTAHINSECMPMVTTKILVPIHRFGSVALCGLIMDCYKGT